MYARDLTWGERLIAGKKYIRSRMNGQPLLVNFEVLEFCNAKCDYCDCWHSKFNKDLVDWNDVVKYIDPLVVAITGGEPLVRKDIAQTVRKVKESSDYTYVYLITNGSLLTEDKADELRDAGLDHLAISLNWTDTRQEEERALPGLMEHLESLIPRLTAKGMPVGIHTIMMDENVDQLVPLALKTHAWGAAISYSSYTDFKNGNTDHMFGTDAVDVLETQVREILRLKDSLGHILTSRYYFENALKYYRNHGIAGCQAGKKFIQLTADGYIKRCADFDPYVYYTDYKPIKQNDCVRCYYSCRGETEAALTPSRIWEMIQG